MISFEMECDREHRFEGIFKDYPSYQSQLDNKMIRCPVCDSPGIKRLYTGCSIQPKASDSPRAGKDTPNLFAMLKIIENYVKDNFEYVGKEFADTARAIYYGVEEERGIYGETTAGEIRELLGEGVSVLPLPRADKFGN